MDPTNILSGWTLTNRKFVVTGGTKGIGYATVRTLLSHGDKVLLCAQTASDVTSSIKALQEQFSTNVHGIA